MHIVDGQHLADEELATLEVLGQQVAAEHSDVSDGQHVRRGMFTRVLAGGVGLVSASIANRVLALEPNTSSKSGLNTASANVPPEIKAIAESRKLDYSPASLFALLQHVEDPRLKKQYFPKFDAFFARHKDELVALMNDPNTIDPMAVLIGMYYDWYIGLLNHRYADDPYSLANLDQSMQRDSFPPPLKVKPPKFGGGKAQIGGRCTVNGVVLEVDGDELVFAWGNATDDGTFLNGAMTEKNPKGISGHDVAIESLTDSAKFRFSLRKHVDSRVAQK